MKLSALVKTFHHERFIRDALESVLSQEVSFPWELVVAEDNSTDGTPALVATFAEDHPGLVRPLMRERNLGPVENFIDALAHCQGEYVALLDGDDFWTSPGKLQRQVSFLETHPEYSACTHDAVLVDEEGRPAGGRYCSPNLSSTLTIERVLEGNPVPACGLVFRRGLLAELPEWFRDLPFTDWALHLLLLEQGPIHYEARADAAYRRHEGGMWSAISDRRRLRLQIETYRLFRDHLGRDPGGVIRRRVAKAWLRLALTDVCTGRREEAWRSLKTALATAGPAAPRLLFSSHFRRLLPHLLTKKGRPRTGATPS